MRALFRKAAVMSPKDPRCYTDYGVFVEKAYGIDGWEIASRAYGSAMALSPTDPHNLCESGRFLHAATGDSERAEYLLWQGVEQGKANHPDTPRMLLQLAVIRVMCPGLPLNGRRGKRSLGLASDVQVAEMLLSTAVMLDPADKQIGAMLEKVASSGYSWNSAWEQTEVRTPPRCERTFWRKGREIGILAESCGLMLEREWWLVSCRVCSSGR